MRFKNRALDKKAWAIFVIKEQFPLKQRLQINVSVIPGLLNLNISICMSPAPIHDQFRPCLG